jgi:hypothetical protein
MTQRNVLPRGASVTDYYNIYTNGVCQIGDNTTNLLTNFTPSTDSASLGIKGNVNCVGISTDVSGSSTGTYYSNSCTALRIPADTSFNRPPTGLKGYIRYNTDTNDVEYYNGGNSSWENIAPATPTLDAVLLAGNSAGSTDINMNGQAITATGLTLPLSADAMTLTTTIGAIALNGDSISLTTTGNNIGLSSGTSVNITASDGVYLTATNDPMNLTATNVNMALLSADGMTLTTSGNPLALTATGVGMTMNATDDIVLTSTADAITLNADLDVNITSQTGNINLTADTTGSGFINMDAFGGVVINKVSGYTPPDYSKTTLDGYAIETFQDTTVLDGTINQLTLSPVELYIDNTNGSAGTQQYGRYAPNTFEIYDHTSIGTNNSRLLVTSTDFDYQRGGSKPTFFPFKFGSAEIFRYDNNGIKTANNKTIVLTDGTTTNTINYLGYTTRNSVQNITHYLNFSDTSATATGSIQKTAGLSCNPSTNTITATTFVASNGTETLTTGALKIGDAGSNKGMSISTGGAEKSISLVATHTGSSATSSLQVSSGGSNTSTVPPTLRYNAVSSPESSSLYLSQNVYEVNVASASGFISNSMGIDAGDVTYINCIKTDTNLGVRAKASTTGVGFDYTTDGGAGWNTAVNMTNAGIATFTNPPKCTTAPTIADQLGNKTYIDNYGGTGGWYYTTTVSITAGTSFAFPNCLSNNYNSYDIHFVPNITSPTTGYPTIQMTITGISVPVYATWFSALGNTATPAYNNTYNTTAPFIQSAVDYSITANRQNTMRLDLWGTRNISGGSGSSRLHFLTEGYLIANPGITGWAKNMGTISYSTGIATGITLTMSVATTGTMTIHVKSKY